MHLTRSLLIPAAALALFAGVAVGNDFSDEDIAAMEGGTALPEGVHTIHFPAIAKQSVTFVSEAAERIAGLVEFDGESSIGEATISIDGDSASAESHLTINVADMRTGNETRDEHLRSEGWMHADEHANIYFHVDNLKKLSDTVYALTGTWTIKGESQQMTTLANLRFIPTFPNFGENIVRVRASFKLPIKEFGVTHEAVGSPAVAEVWDVDITLLGLPVEGEE